MKILFVVPYVPDRIRARSLSFIRGLKKRRHEISVMTLWSSAWEQQSAGVLQNEVDELVLFRQSKLRSAWNCLKALPTNVPLQAVWSWNPHLAQSTVDVITQSINSGPFDIVHVEHLRGAKFGLWLKDQLPSHGVQIPIVWDSVDCISLLFRLASRRGRSWFARWVTRFELPRTERIEASLPGQFDATLATSPQDAEALRQLSHVPDDTHNIHVLTNGIDIEYFNVNPEVQRERKRIVMTGKMSYHANVSMALDFYEHIFPGIKNAHSDVEFWIVGKDPTREVRSLGDDPAVHVTGTVADIRPYLWSATLAIAPLSYAVGVQFKVLEAMACGTPVVVSPEGVSSLQIVAGRDAKVPENWEQFTAVVNHLLSDPPTRDELGRNGRAYIEEHHSWGRIAERLEELYHGLIDANS